MRFFVTALFIFSAAHTAFGQEHYEFYTGIRGLGMGGAQIATVNDETALLVNPAGLGKLRDYFITVVDPEITLGGETESIAGTSYSVYLEPQEILQLMSEATNQDKHFHAKGQIFPSAVFPNFGIGVLANFQTDAEYNTDTAPELFELNYRSDIAVVFGFNFRIWDGRIKLGFNSKIINRNQIFRSEIPVDSTGLTIENLAQEGVAIASDAGLIITMPWALLPTIAAVYRNVGDTSFTIRDKGLINGIEDNAPERIDGDVDVGFALFPIAGKRSRIAFAGEYRGVLTASDEEDSSKRIHVGLELNYADAIFVRAGMNQRYWTAGLEIAVANYQLQLASYGEEIGTAEVNKEDRRYMAKFAYRF